MSDKAQTILKIITALEAGKTVMQRWERDIGYTYYIDGGLLPSNDFRLLDDERVDYEVPAIDEESWYEVHRLYLVDQTGGA